MAARLSRLLLPDGVATAMALLGFGVAAACAGVAAATEQWLALAVVFGLAAVGVFSVLVLWRPDVALRVSLWLVVVATTKFRDRDPTALLSGDIDAQIIFELLSYVVALTAVVSSLLSPSRHRPPARPSRTELLLGGYVLLVLASAFWSANLTIAIGRAIQLAILYSLSVVAVRRLGAVRVLQTLATAAVAYVLVAAGLAVIFPWARNPSELFSWFAVHPAQAGMFAGSAAIFLIAGAMYAPGAWHGPLRRLVLRAGIVTCIVILIATHERTPVFAFAASAVTLWLRAYLRPRAAAMVLGSLFLVFGIALSNLGALYGGTRAVSDYANPIAVYLLRGQSGEQFLALSGRVELWDYVSSLARERPLLGYGYTASRSILLERFPWAGETHGALQAVVLNLGLVGLVLLGLIVLGTLASSFMGGEMRRAPGAWVRAMVLGTFVFLMVEALAGESFAGVAGYETLLFFCATVAYAHLNDGSVPAGYRRAGGDPSLPPFPREAFPGPVRNSR